MNCLGQASSTKERCKNSGSKKPGDDKRYCYLHQDQAQATIVPAQVAKKEQVAQVAQVAKPNQRPNLANCAHNQNRES